MTVHALFKIIIHSKSIKKQQSKDMCMRPWKQCFVQTEWHNSSGEMQILWKNLLSDIQLSLKMLRFAEYDQIQYQMQIIQNQQNHLSYHNSYKLPDSLLFRTLYSFSHLIYTQTLNHVTLICLTCKEWVCQVRYHPAGNQPFLSPGDIVNFKQESFPYIVGEGNKIETTSHLCSHEKGFRKHSIRVWLMV